MSEPQTYVLQYEKYSYAGNFMPAMIYPLDLSKADVAYAAGTQVVKGEDLRAQTPEIQEMLARLQAKIDHAMSEKDRVLRALAELNRGGFAYEWVSDASPESDEVRQAGHEIQSTIISYNRSVSDYTLQAMKTDADIASLQTHIALAAPCDEAEPVSTPATPQITPQISCTDNATLLNLRQQITDLNGARESARTDLSFTKMATDNQLGSSFEALAGVYDRLIDGNIQQIDTYHVPSPDSGTLSIEDGKAYVLSAEFVFVYIATETQVEALSAATDLKAEVDGHVVADLLLASVNFSAEFTTDFHLPKYEMTFSAENTRHGFVPSSHGTATMTRTSTSIVIPPDFLGLQGERNYVLLDGREVTVQVVKNADGQWVLLSPYSSLSVGDVIQEVVGG
ncbi:MAG: hypothetical protein LBI84_04320 [Propionibacteriaceae bacterium]|nr:hypothetical protein [Propionibacteriaceae bacterium]